MRGQCLNPFRRCNDGWRTKGATKRIYILFEFTLAVSRPVAGSSSIGAAAAAAAAAEAAAAARGESLFSR